MSERVGAARRRAVIDRAVGCCEYCGLPDDVLRLPHEPDHIAATQHGGQTTPDNLACTCFRCNRFKGPNLASIDPQTGEVVLLFHPRNDCWTEHFRWRGAEIIQLTGVGRATASLLRFNDPERIVLRNGLMRQGRYRFLERS